MLESGWWYPQDSKRPGGPVITWEPIRGPSPDKRMNGAKVIPDGFDFPWLDSKTAAGQTDHSPLIMHNRAFSPDCTCPLHPHTFASSDLSCLIANCDDPRSYDGPEVTDCRLLCANVD